MLALILAGGRGTRYGPGEKPLALCGGVPMIERVAAALGAAGLEVVVVASPATPFTQNWCRAHDLLCVCASGAGYVEDLAEALTLLDPGEPVLCVSADLPCLTARIVETVVAAYGAQARPALSVWVPVRDEGNALYVEEIEGIHAVPAGINVLDGGRAGEQEETRIVLDDPALLHNVNTRAALASAGAFLKGVESERGPDCDHRKKDIDRNTT